jgi:hypothetical protein
MRGRTRIFLAASGTLAAAAFVLAITTMPLWLAAEPRVAVMAGVR